MVVCRSESGIVTKRLSGCHWDVSWSEGVMDGEESGEYIEKAELSCVGGSELSKMGGVTEGKTPFKYMVERGEKCTRTLRVLAVQ